MKVLAKITNKTFQPNGNGSHVCDVECPRCGTKSRVSFGGWCAIICPTCDAELYRNKASLNSES